MEIPAAKIYFPEEDREWILKKINEVLEHALVGGDGKNRLLGKLREITALEA